MRRFLLENNFEFYKKYPLKNMTTIKNDGYAKYYVVIKDINELVRLICYLKDKKIKFLIIGNGSKIIFLNNYKGVIISLKKLNKILIDKDVEVDSGVNIFTLISRLKDVNLGGIEAMCGIPSSIGGALANNASSHNISLYDYLDRVLVYDGKLKILYKKDIDYNYRYSSLKNNCIILKAYFNFIKIDKNIIQNNINKFIDYRKNNQVISYPNIGSIFKNKENIKAVDIIKKCKLENYHFRNVSLSSKHLNFLNIKGEVKGKYIYKFVKNIQKKVYKLEKIKLDSEIIFIKT